MPSEKGVMKLCARIGMPFSLAALTAVTAESVPMGLIEMAWTPFWSSCSTVVTKAWKSPSEAGAWTSSFQPSSLLLAVAPSTIATWNGLVKAGGTKPTYGTLAAGASGALVGSGCAGAWVGAGCAGAGAAGGAAQPITITRTAIRLTTANKRLRSIQYLLFLGLVSR